MEKEELNQSTKKKEKNRTFSISKLKDIFTHRHSHHKKSDENKEEEEEVVLNTTAPATVHFQGQVNPIS